MFRLSLRKVVSSCEYTWSRYSLTIKRTNLSTSSTFKAKLFRDTENTYCYGIIGSLQTANIDIPRFQSPSDLTAEANSEPTFNTILNANYRQKTASEIVSTFKLVAPYCIQHDIKLSDSRFNNLVDGLMDNAEKLTDSELLQLLDVINELPSCNTINDHNFHDVWSCLDDICCWRIHKWNYDMLFAVSEKWYNLNLGKIGDFIFEAVDKMSRKPERRLTKQQLVNVFFLMNVCRKRPVQFEYEFAISKRIEEFTVDELAIIALGYFKTQSKIKIPHIMTQMLSKAKETKDIHEMTLCAILKAIRYSPQPNLADQIKDFLEHITCDLHKFSTLCVLHACLLGTTLQIEHQPSLKIAAQRIASNITNTAEVRLKDIERLLLALTMFDYDPETKPCIYDVSLQELHAKRRDPEFTRHPKCLGTSLSFLAIRNKYSKELLSKVLDDEYVTEVYGKAAKIFPRELFVLDTNIDIEVKDYDGPRLDSIKRRKVTKWLTAFTPDKNQSKVTAADKLILMVQDTVKKIVDEKNIYIDHVLPQYVRSDIIICREKSTGKYVKPTGFENYILGDTMSPTNTEEYEYFAIVIVGWNNTIRDTPKPVGLINMKLRHLKSIGFKPITVIWNEFMQLSEDQKQQYIENKIASSE